MFGNDYDTLDGTGSFVVIKQHFFFSNGHIKEAGISSIGVRDYIHVVDLAKGHIAALKKLKENCGCKVGRSKCVCVC